MHLGARLVRAPVVGGARATIQASRLLASASKSAARRDPHPAALTVHDPCLRSTNKIASGTKNTERPTSLPTKVFKSTPVVPTPQNASQRFDTRNTSRPRRWTNTHERERQRLYHLLLQKTRFSPSTTAGDLLEWYFERVKESRTRLAEGSADSRAAIMLLIHYAFRRRDVHTLKRLYASAAYWSQKERHSQALGASSGSNGVDPLLKLQTILFSVAARQNNWQAMHMLVTSGGLHIWTPFMCRAFLRTEGALDMIQAPSVAPPPGASADVRAKHELWAYFLDGFGTQLRCAQAQLPEGSQPTLPSWVVLTLLELYARSGRSALAMRLVQQYLGTRMQTTNLVLRRAPSALLSNMFEEIPGPQLLNRLLAAHTVGGTAGDVLGVFVQFTRTAGLSYCSGNKQGVLEPDNNSILLVLDALRSLHGPTVGGAETMLHVLFAVDRTWGPAQKLVSAAAHVAGQPSVASKPANGSFADAYDTATMPLFVDFRVMTRLFRTCLDANAVAVARRALRFQQGLLRRELRWHESVLHSRSALFWTSSPNEYSMLRSWTAMLRRLQRRRWMCSAHVNALYTMALRVTVMRTQLRRRRNQPHTHVS